MIANRYITGIVAVVMAMALFLCFAAMAFSDTLAAAAGGTGITMEYESKLFDTSNPLSVNIIIDDESWDEMINNAVSEQYYKCDVQINGETFYSVGIRPKGNTSLTAIANDSTTDRYSFKLEFDRYIDGQTCFGLDKLVLNNNYSDYTCMKEALVYDMYQYLGADASLYNYAGIYVNGEYWGVYLALEAVEESFMLRNYGSESGALYKPEGVNVGGGMKNAAGETGQSSAGADLNYTDDSTESYSAIWEGEVTGTSDSDHQRVVEALKNISEGNDLDVYMDIDNILKYMAVHAFSVNDDSLSGNMAHNYYLYEYEGRLNILPWDYNMAFGSMGGSDASAVINDAIDTPFDGTEFFDALLENEEYLVQYHTWLQMLTEQYVYSGAFDEFYERTRTQLDSLVESDPTSFCTYEEYTAAAEMLYNLVLLRTESICGQLDGSIPSTDEQQRQDSSALVDASSIDLTVMGSMNSRGVMAAGNFGVRGNEFGKFQEAVDNAETDAESVSYARSDIEASVLTAGQNSTDAGTYQTGTDFRGPGGERTFIQDGDAGENIEETPPEGNTENTGGQSDTENDAQNEETMPEEPAQDAQSNDVPQMPENQMGQANGDMRGQNFPGADEMQSTFQIGTEQSAVKQNLIIYGICFAVLVSAVIFAALFRRRSYKR